MSDRRITRKSRAVMREVEALLPSDDEEDVALEHLMRKHSPAKATSTTRPPPAKHSGAKRSAATALPSTTTTTPDHPKRLRIEPTHEDPPFSNVDFVPQPPPPQHQGSKKTSPLTPFLLEPSKKKLGDGVFRGSSFAVFPAGKEMGPVRGNALCAVVQRNGGEVVTQMGAVKYLLCGFSSLTQLGRCVKEKLGVGAEISDDTVLRGLLSGKTVVCNPGWVTECIAKKQIISVPTELQPQHGCTSLQTRQAQILPTPTPTPHFIEPKEEVSEKRVKTLFNEPFSVSSMVRSQSKPGGDNSGFIPVFFRGESESLNEPESHEGTVTMAARQNRLPPKGVFVCEKGASGVEEETKNSPQALNEHLVAELSRLQEVYAKLGDHWRKYAYGKAVAILRKWQSPIRCQEDIQHIRGIGSKIAQKIGEILQNGTSSKMKYFEANEEVSVITKFGKIWGVGPATAQRLYRTLHLTTMEELRGQQHNVLNAQQRIGLKYLEELQHRIPRTEVDCMKRLIQKKVKALCPTMHMQICGSYRRGKDTCGDIDVILCNPTGQPYVGVLKSLVLELKGVGFITDELTSAYMNDDAEVESDHDTFMGICQMPPCSDASTCTHTHLCEVQSALSATTHLHRRIDIKIYSRRQWPFALLYFTGSDYFNRSMRLYCQKRGYSLSDKGIQPVVRVAKEKVHEGAYVPGCKTEKDIFDLLGLQYKTPEERNV